MKICLPHDPGAAPDYVRQLSFTERRNVIDTLLGRASEHPTAFLKATHDAHHWIACDCRGDATPPVLHTRKSSAGHYTLVRMPGRTPHTPGCPIAEGLSDLYDDHLTPELTGHMISTAAGAGALRVWHQAVLDPPPTIWTMIAAMARHAPSAGVHTGQIVTHPSRLNGLAVRLRGAAIDGSKQIGTALIATRSVERGAITPLAKDAEPIHIRGPIVELAPLNGNAAGIAWLRIARGTDGRYEPIAAVVTPVCRGSPVITPTPASVELAPLLHQVGRTLRTSHHIAAHIDLAFPSGLDQQAEVRVEHESGHAISLHVGRPAVKPPAGSNLYILLASDRRSTDTDDYPARLAGYIADRLKQAHPA